MKNLKNILAMLVLVTVMGVSTSFGGVYVIERTNNNDTRGCTPKVGTVYNTGILIAGEGILIAGEGILIALEGLIMSDRANTPCVATEGILIA